MTEVAPASDESRGAGAVRPAPRRPPRKPGSAPVVWGSLALFAVLFGFLTNQLAASVTGSAATAQPALVRKVVKRKVVTTIVPTPGRSTVTSGPVYTSESGSAAAPVTTGAS